MPVAVRAFVPVTPISFHRPTAANLSARRISRLPLPPARRAARVPLTVTVSSSASAPVAPVVLEEPLRSGVGQRARIGSETVSFEFWDAPSTLTPAPAIVFLPGFFFQKDRRAIATALAISARRAGHPFFTADYYGTGGSGGDFVKDGCMTTWIAHTRALVDEIIGDQPVVYVGVGIGAWMMLHVAKGREHVVGLVGQSPTCDFTVDVIEPRLSEGDKEQMATKGFVEKPWGQTSYPIGRKFMEDSKQWLVLQGGERSVEGSASVRLIAGIKDDEYPSGKVNELVDVLQSEDVIVSYIKDRKHVLEDEQDFGRLFRAVRNVCDCWYEYDLRSPGSG